MRAPTRWWDPVEVATGASARWRIAGLELVATRAASEWRISYRRSDSEAAAAADWEFDAEWSGPTELDRLARYLFAKTEGTCRLRPLLADRAVVASPRVPVSLQPGEEASLFVGSPLWVAVEVGSRPTRLQELPVRRPSDTWFGPSTLDGELCYAARTRAALDAASLPALADRALTTVRLRNTAAVPLAVERLKLPVPYLALWQADGEQLWTGGVTLVRAAEGTMASLEIASGAPRAAAGARLVSEPRHVSEPGLLIRAFSTLFRGQEGVD